MYRCEHVASQKLSPELNNIVIRQLRLSITRDRILHLRLLEALCVSMAAQNRHIIFHAEMMRLSRERVLARLFKLGEEANQFRRK